MTINEIIRKTYLKYKLSPLDSGILLSSAIKKPKEYILAHPEKNIAPAQIKKYLSFAERRSSGEPVAYILEKKEFFGLDFIVDKNVLVPRPETELLVEHAIEKIKNIKLDIFDAIIDVGTGSGNIIVSIAKNVPKIIEHKINFYALDISKESLKVAKKNAKKYKLDKKIKFIQSDLLGYFSKEYPPEADQPLAENSTNILIVANLPYVSPKIYQANKNNLKFEPESALLSRKNGLDHYIKLFEQVRMLFTIHCSLILEFSPEQKPEMSHIIKKYLPKAKTIFRQDLAGKWRVAEIKTSSWPSPY